MPNKQIKSIRWLIPIFIFNVSKNEEVLIYSHQQIMLLELSIIITLLFYIDDIEVLLLSMFRLDAVNLYGEYQ